MAGSNGKQRTRTEPIGPWDDQTPPLGRQRTARATPGELMQRVTWPQIGVVLVVVAMVAGGAMAVSSKADGSEVRTKADRQDVREAFTRVEGAVEDLRKRLRDGEVRSERIEHEVRASRRETRMLIRALRPQISDRLEPLAGEEP